MTSLTETVSNAVSQCLYNPSELFNSLYGGILNSFSHFPGEIPLHSPHACSLVFSSAVEAVEF